MLVLPTELLQLQSRACTLVYAHERKLTHPLLTEVICNPIYAFSE